MDRALRSVRGAPAAARGVRFRDLGRYPLLVRVTALLVVYSLLVWLLVFSVGLEQRPDYAPGNYRTYFQKVNWFLYPVFFPVIAVLVAKSWRPFVRAWRDEPPGVALLRTADGSPVPDRIRRLFVDEVDGSRKWLVPLALLLSLIFNAWDTRETFTVYLTDEAVERCEYAKAEPDFFTHWAFADPLKHCPTPPWEEPSVGAPPYTQWSIMLACYLQQFTIVAMGFMVLLQLLAHVAFFRWPGLTRSARRFGLRIRLDPDAPSRDFGLTRWNRALDSVYYYLSLGLFVPILSRIGHQGDPNPGHKAGEVLILVLWAAPILFTISTRQKWAYEAQERAMIEGREAVLRFKENHIWPLDLPVLGKIWIGLAFALYMVYLAKDWKELLGVLGKFLGAG